MQVRFLGREDPLEKETAMHSNIIIGKSHGQTHSESDTTEATEHACSKHAWVLTKLAGSAPRGKAPAGTCQAPGPSPYPRPCQPSSWRQRGRYGPHLQMKKLRLRRGREHRHYEILGETVPVDQTACAQALGLAWARSGQRGRKGERGGKQLEDLEQE